MSLLLSHPVLMALLAIPAVMLLAAMLRPHTRRARTLSALRASVLALLVLALAEPVVVNSSRAATTIFVIDRSLSVSAGRQGEIEAWVTGTLNGAGSDQRAAVVSFAASGSVAANPSNASSLQIDWAVPGGDAGGELTDIESGLALARALPVAGNRRIVLVSDGVENSGHAAFQVVQAQQDGVPIDVLTLPGVAEDDLRVDAISVPSAIWQGSPVSIVATISSSTPANGTLAVRIDGTTVVELAVALDAGLTTFTIDAPSLSAGFHRIDVSVSSSSAIDTFAENNLASSAIVVRDAPRVLFVAPARSDPSRLVTALEGNGAVVTRVPPSEVPARISEIASFDAVVLDNVAASELTIDQIAVLETATRQLGRGLVIVGGTNAFGPGNYADSALEPVLPVKVKSSDARERPRVALLLIIDRSGSMSYDEGGGSSKIDMAKEAVLQASGALLDGDTIGVLAFSDEQQWVVPLRTLDGSESRQEIAAAVQAVTATGGTEIFPALQAGFDAIRNTDADVRHVVLLSDGKSRTGTAESYQKLIADAGLDRTTLSTIAIGNDADTELLQQLSAWGNGRYHFTERPEDIPNLTLQEARSASNQSVIRGAFPVIQANPSPILTGIDIATIPTLNGYDYTEAKPGAQTILTSSRADPLLAKWQYGLGRVVAWTSDNGADLAIGWSGWSGYQTFWGNLLRWSLPDPEFGQYAVDAERSGADTVITVTRTDGGDGVPDLRIRTVAPDGTVREGLLLQRIGSGAYQVRVGTSMAGAYQVDIPNDDGSIATLGFTMPSSPELLPLTDGKAFMASIAADTGGRILDPARPDEVFDARDGGGATYRESQVLWPFLTAAALLVFLFELAVRTGFAERIAVLAPVSRRPTRSTVDSTRVD